jgi:hypothetical protein
LVNRRHLEWPERGGGNYIIGAEWLTKLRPGHMPPPKEKEQAPVLVELEAVTEPVQQTAQVRTAASPADRLTQLATLAKRAGGKRKRLADVRSEIKAIEELIALQNARLTSLQHEETGLEDALAKPEYKDAEERFAQVNKLLGGS